MSFKPSVLALSALLCVAACPAGAQTVYKCGTAGAVKYSDRPCSRRVVTTDDAAVPAPADARRARQNRALAQALRRRPGETEQQFALRRHRAAMLAEDRAECARLDTRMPVERASMINPDPDEVAKAAAALATSRKRFGELRC